MSTGAYLAIMITVMALMGLGPWFGSHVKEWRERRRERAGHMPTVQPYSLHSPEWPVVLHSKDYYFARLGGHITFNKFGRPYYKDRVVVVDDSMTPIDYWGKCKRFNPYGPTPCKCCPAECEG